MLESDKKYINAKQDALIYMNKNRKIIWWCLKEVRIWNAAFNHLIWKRKNHKREVYESYVRFKCFIHIDKILKNLNLYQEYKTEMENIRIKRWWKYINQKVSVEYFGFIWILFSQWLRIKVVVRKVNWWSHWELVSVIPAWESIWYKNTSFKQTFYENWE